MIVTSVFYQVTNSILNLENVQTSKKCQSKIKKKKRAVCQFERNILVVDSLIFLLYDGSFILELLLGSIYSLSMTL